MTRFKFKEPEPIPTLTLYRRYLVNEMERAAQKNRIKEENEYDKYKKSFKSIQLKDAKAKEEF